MDQGWLVGRELDPHAELRLFCLPYAGGGAAVYRGWQDMFPRQIQVCAVELPGRGGRLREAPFERLVPLVRALSAWLATVTDRPYALFGHSLGGLIAFELARALRERGCPPPEHVFVSATAAPGTPPSQPLVHLSHEAGVKKRLRELNGTPRELLDNDELMNLMLPTVRADFSVLETYEFVEKVPLAVPLTVYGGVGDKAIPTSVLGGWRRHTSRDWRLALFAGDHFFIHSAMTEVVSAVVQALK